MHRENCHLGENWKQCPACIAQHNDTCTPGDEVSLLTELQKSVLERLRKGRCSMLAAITEEHWKRGESYYIDDRVGVSRRLRADFNKANEQVIPHET